MVFRNFPLTQIHPQALPAAIAAEATREQGNFQQVHETLFEKQETLNSNLILQIAKDHRLDMKRFQKSQQTTALKAVRKDTKEAEALRECDVSWLKNGKFKSGVHPPASFLFIAVLSSPFSLLFGYNRHIHPVFRDILAFQGGMHLTKLIRALKERAFCAHSLSTANHPTTVA